MEAGDGMSREDAARRTVVEVAFGGVDITKSIRPYFISLTYTDKEEDETDDLQLQLQDREQLWMEQWLAEAVDAAAAARLNMEARIIRENWNGDGKDVILPCGSFELDSVTAGGPPSTVTVKGTSLAFSSSIRQTEKSKAWESYYLSGIAGEMASAAGMTLMYEAGTDPYYARVEQVKTSDISFLSTLCHNAGISLKATDGMLVLFDQMDYEGKRPVFTIRRGSGAYLSYDLETGSAKTKYASCRVSYVDQSGTCIAATAWDPDQTEDNQTDQRLEITARVSSIGEAQALAEKMLRLRNKYEKTASFTLPGNPALVAGVTVELEKWGAWSGRYIVKQAQHTVGSAGYTTKVTLRKCLEGY